MGAAYRLERTEAGRRLSDLAPKLWEQPEAPGARSRPVQIEVREAILEIEDQAVAAYKVELAEKVRALPRITMAYPPDDPVYRGAVLRLIEDPAPEEASRG